MGVSGTHHTQRHSSKVPEETSRAGVKCIEQSVIARHVGLAQATDQWQDRLSVCVKAKGKHFEHLL